METLDVARKLGIASVTLRLWERRGLIGPIQKDSRGWRQWSERDVAECRKLLTKLHGGGQKPETR